MGWEHRNYEEQMLKGEKNSNLLGFVGKVGGGGGCCAKLVLADDDGVGAANGAGLLDVKLELLLLLVILLLLLLLALFLLRNFLFSSSWMLPMPIIGGPAGAALLEDSSRKNEFYLN